MESETEKQAVEESWAARRVFCWWFICSRELQLETETFCRAQGPEESAAKETLCRAAAHTMVIVLGHSKPLYCEVWMLTPSGGDAHCQCRKG